MAVVDLGSTAVRLRLARITPGSGYRELVQERVATRLGGGAPGTRSRDAIDRTLRAVRRFFARHSSNGRGPRIVAVATSAVRDARNRERLLAPLRCDQGIEVQVLSARDEARLGVSAALAGLSFEDASLPLGAVEGVSRRPRCPSIRAGRFPISATARSVSSRPYEVTGAGGAGAWP